MSNTAQEERLKTDANIFIDRAIEILKDEYNRKELIAGYNGMVSLLGYAKQSHSASLSQPEILGGKSKEEKLRKSLEDLYNALDSIPNSRKSGTLAEHCDMELAKSLINQPRTQQ